MEKGLMQLDNSFDATSSIINDACHIIESEDCGLPKREYYSCSAQLVIGAAYCSREYGRQASSWQWSTDD